MEHTLTSSDHRFPHHVHHIHSHQHQCHKTTRIRYRKIEELRLRRKREKILARRKNLPKLTDIPLQKRKLLCKFRKSCYQTGNIPLLPSLKLKGNENNKEMIMKSSLEVEEEEEKEALWNGPINMNEIKLLCKYRKTCYDEIGNLRENKTNERLHLLSKRQQTAISSRKKTLKEVAKNTIRELKMKEEKAARKPKAIKIIVDKKLDDKEEEMKERLVCKYRKSCYKTGQLILNFPSHSFLPKFLTKHIHLGDPISNISFDELNLEQKKLFCKYRKSCYENGQQIIIPQERIFKYEHFIQKNEKEIPIQIKCKYRKSCYNTGVFNLTENIYDIQLENKEETKEIPLTAEHLKLFCKYRKSCYNQKALEDIERNDKCESKCDKEIPLNQELLRNDEKLVATDQKIEKDQTESQKQNINDTKEIKKKAKIQNTKIQKATKEHKTTNTRESEIIKSTKQKKLDILREKKFGDILQQNKKKEKIRKKIKGKDNTSAKSSQEMAYENESIKVNQKYLKKKELKTKENSSEIRESENKNNLNKKEETAKINMTDEELSDKFNLIEKLRCKYRKSCYQSGVPPEPKDLTIYHFSKKEEEHLPIELKCKYRKSCYENGILPKIIPFHKVEPQTIKNESKKKRCKYRKSCYETGEMPKIEQKFFLESIVRKIFDEIAKEEEEIEQEMDEEQRKLKCKYRKSCYQTGILPQITKETMKTIAETMKEPISTKEQICKYRKSCYAIYDIRGGKKRLEINTRESKKIANKFGKTSLQRRTTEKKKTSDKNNKIKSEVEKKKKTKKPFDVDKELEYMQIQQQINITDEDKKHITIAEKLKCKYRHQCYNDVSVQLEMKKEEIMIKNLRRPNGAPCNIYYISCRLKVGLPIKEKAPIGPNGRKLCRKKPKDDEENKNEKNVSSSISTY